MTTLIEDETGQGLNHASNVVAVGSRVEVELVAESGERESLAFDLAPDDQADFSSGLLGLGTPLAQAVLGQRAGSVVAYRMGDIREVKILSVTAGLRARQADATASRQAVIQKAISQSDLADAVRFALTVDQKWGETDPEGIISSWDDRRT